MLCTAGFVGGALMQSCQEPAPKEAIVVDFDQVHQTIDGFGFAEADWADDVFIFPNRDAVIEALFGETGLKANILRGEIFPHYSDDKGNLDFALKSDTSLQVAQNPDKLERNDLLRRGQFWLTSHVQQKFPETLFTFSVWSPPAWMKQDSHATPMYPASGGKLRKDHYQNFADYLTTFYKAFEEIGVKTYAISPSNEPGFAAPWNSCVWTYDEMGDFIHNYLLPTFEKEKVGAKVQFGENPAWSTVFDKLKMISSADFCNDLLKKYPLDSKRVIAAGHGYVLPDTLPLPTELRRTPIIPYVEAQKRNIPMWVTEISDITPLDVSMEDGLYWAASFQKYLMDAHVSGLVWWCGAMPTKTNESLVVLDQKTGKFVLSKRYDAFGNYTRYIPVGSQCVGNQKVGLTDEVSVTTFKKGKNYTVVVVNEGNQAATCRLQLKGAKAVKEMSSYVTTEADRWKEGKVSLKGDYYVLDIAPKSVVTYTGVVE